MANLLDIRRRIKSVKNTQQITKAMKMVSAAKLKRAQDRVIAARPFANKMVEVVGDLANRIGDDFSHPLLDPRGDERYLVVLITADKGLCGGFNTNLTKAAFNYMREHPEKQIEMLPVGRKGRDFFRRRGATLVGEYLNITGKGQVDVAEATEIADDIVKRFIEDEGIDKVFLIYNEFKNVMQQQVVVDQILPVAQVKNEGGEAAETAVDYLYEQPPAEIFGGLLPRLIESRIFRALLESVAAEQGSRMTAMESATKNAGELISSLTLNMNRIRQAKITNEIIEVVSGAAAAQ